MEYLLKASAVITIFYGCYLLFLQRDTFFKQNRWFLLSGLVVSFLIPLYVIKEYVTATAISVTGLKTTQIVNPTVQNTIDANDILIYLYLTGVVVFIVRFIFQIGSLVKLIYQSTRHKLGNYTFVETDTNNSPFSFFNWIVYNPKQFNNTELEQIINHEKIHAKQYHTIDVLLNQIACIALWFNPIIWLYNKQLKQNLEFLADNNAFKKTASKKEYQYTLLKTSLPTHQLALSNPFYNSLIKKRIVMLHKSKSKKINLIKYAFVLPLLAIFLMSFNTKTVYIETEQPIKITPNSATNIAQKQNEIITATISKTSTEGDLIKITEKLKNAGVTANFKGVKRNKSGEITAIKIDAKSKTSNANYNVKHSNAISAIHIVYNPENDSIVIGNDADDEKEIEIIEVLPTKKRKSYSTHKTTAVHEDADEVIEVVENNIEVINSKKDNVKTHIITSDSLYVVKEHVGETIILEHKNDNQSDDHTNIVIRANTNGSPIYILNGKLVDKKEIRQLDHKKIDHINVLKDESAIKKYGKKAENGVIEIYTQN